MKSTPEALQQENALAERAAGYWLLGAAVVVLLPHVPRLPVWLSTVLAALFAWRFFMLQRAWPAPNRWWRWSLTALLVFLLYRQYGTLFGRDAGSALLAAMLALKFMELQRLRDYVLSVLLIYFLIVIGFLYSQAMWLVVYLLAVFVLTTATLIRLAVPGARARFALRLAAVLLLQALPLMLAMHLLFPRLQGALWGLPQDAYAGLTGLSEEMHPGSINELSLSEEVAFRAHFHGALPPPAQRYWRALVLWTTDGKSWTRGAEPRAQSCLRAAGCAPLLLAHARAIQQAVATGARSAGAGAVRNSPAFWIRARSKRPGARTPEPRVECAHPLSHAHAGRGRTARGAATPGADQCARAGTGGALARDGGQRCRGSARGACTLPCGEILLHP